MLGIPGWPPPGATWRSLKTTGRGRRGRYPTPGGRRSGLWSVPACLLPSAFVHSVPSAWKPLPSTVHSGSFASLTRHLPRGDPHPLPPPLPLHSHPTLPFPGLHSLRVLACFDVTRSPTRLQAPRACHTHRRTPAAGTVPGDGQWAGCLSEGTRGSISTSICDRQVQQRVMPPGGVGATGPGDNIRREEPKAEGSRGFKERRGLFCKGPGEVTVHTRNTGS